MTFQDGDVDDCTSLEGLHYAPNVWPEPWRSCLAGTRTSILARVRDWALLPAIGNILLLHGAAGIGKSAIVNTIGRELQSSDHAIVPFFSFDRSVTSRSVDQLIFTWARHLARCDPQYLNYPRSLDIARLQIFSLTVQLETLLTTGLANLGEGKRIILVIDALDECPAHECEALLSFLSYLSSHLPPYCRCLVTCRTNSDILISLDYPLILKISVDDEQSTVEDIRSFVQHQLGGKPDFKDLVEDVVYVAQRVFERAALICRELTLSDTKALLVRDEFVRKLKERKLVSIHAICKQILEMYVHPPQLKTFRLVMAWVFQVSLPQTRRVLLDISAITLPHHERFHVDDIFSRLGSLLSGSTSDDIPIRPFHTSLRDFLVDRSHSGTFHVDLGPHLEHMLASACLKLMNTNLKFNICDLPTSCALNTEVSDPNMKQRVLENISPGLQYACLSVAYHMQRSIPLSRTRHQPTILQKSMLIASVIMIWTLRAYSVICLVIALIDRFLPLRTVLTLALAYSSFSERMTVIWLFVVDTARRAIHSFRIRVFKNGSPDIATELELFLKEKFLYWLEALSCMAATTGTPSSTLHALSAWTASMGYSALSSTLWDFVEFDFQFQEGYMRSAPQVYYSGLTFTPQKSKIAKFYAPMFCNPIAACIGYDGETAWPSPYDVVIYADSRHWDQRRIGFAGILGAAFSPDGTRIAARSYFGSTLTFWDAATGQILYASLQSCPAVDAFAFSPDGAHIVIARERDIGVWDAATGKKIGKLLSGHSDNVVSVAFSADGTRIVSGSHDKTIRLWDAATGQPIGRPLSGHQRHITFVVFSPDGSRIVSSSYDHTVRIWDATTGQQIGDALNGHTFWVTSVVFSPDGTQIASGSDDSTVRLWDAATGREVCDPMSNGAAVLSVAFSPDGKFIAAGCEDFVVRLWDAATAQLAGAH
ncbi:hypothetical protein HGRIS_004312 [Hohenbuehelia grisea]|uniref:NACHT domain-containing protein n=1 Tax=Hohenbuehelia grisea TaxID=104357 RepID=A0ABR3IPE9_9AGAR